ncbi:MULTISPECIES: cytidine deaminase [Staphylococcus]|jgi:cytidine deaminase|uniref:Cytidine deaminase n=1 Tax=Staphylococcus nepalensis TaxID=214473 RepID=A0A2T4SCI5_9STAP|nr:MULTISPECIES: cytidine deaminase [Staphylococcus]MBO1205075.1 cytidine deaminase [Staphylococcus nepalensis]MBO1213380.1 cytidine deaminase [Staphylococcus nepalensis]MBO1215399.1 cytidine deaminase [Staphylococcus nepalensis]MBO1226040.1 cytidine deaminase [Staphylococcus nepalensis]MBO1234468.1 cytidine deaminase [Staphylococcus nepalensis]
MAYQPHYYTEVRKAQENAYAPYSQFKVGAYLITKDGKTYRGGNVENAAYPLGICAERSSLVAAIADGYRPGDFESITVTVDADEPSSPCGACRQVLKELCDDDMPVYMTNHKEDMIQSTVSDLLPLGFSGKDLN